jgi:hypothetical protein
MTLPISMSSPSAADRPELTPDAAGADAIVCAELLSVWDALALEIGDTAVVTDGHPWSRLCALVASWYGALPVLFLTTGSDGPEGIVTVRVDDPAAAIKHLSATLAPTTGVAAVDLGGRADHIDLLLESLPRFSRLMLAGPPGESLTIDFYVNVHRRGLRLLSRVLDPRGGTGHAPASAEHLARAQRLLANPRRQQEFRGARDGVAARRTEGSA